ncbi:MAG TPA: R3H domain-containing nucleic acid-binding protein [Thermoanaerobaculia bacterium]
MRFEAKTEADAVEQAARALQKSAAEVRYHVVRDEKSFWGGRIVEIDVDAPAPEEAQSAAERPVRSAEKIGEEWTGARVEVAEVEVSVPGRSSRPRRSEPAPLDEESFAAVESTLSELLSAAGFLVETRRKSSPDEMVIELIGDDVEPLLANKGEGLNGLEVLTGRLASRRLGHPVYPRLDAEGFRAHQRESLEELAHRSAEEAKRTRRVQLLPPLAPGERRLVHLALSSDPEVETESEGDGYLKRVAVKLKSL